MVFEIIHNIVVSNAPRDDLAILSARITEVQRTAITK